MCTYCMVGDDFFRRNPPWSPFDPTVPWPPSVPIPLPATPINPWPVEQLKEFLDLLERVKKLEDKFGCPCEPNKADYLDLLKRRIEDLEKKSSANPENEIGDRAWSLCQAVLIILVQQ